MLCKQTITPVTSVPDAIRPSVRLHLATFPAESYFKAQGSSRRAAGRLELDCLTL